MTTNHTDPTTDPTYCYTCDGIPADGIAHDHGADTDDTDTNPAYAAPSTIDGYACATCALFVTYGDTSMIPDGTDHDAYVDAVVARTDGYYVYVTGDDTEFSWSPCDVCGTRLGGTRSPVTFVTVAS